MARPLVGLTVLYQFDDNTAEQVNYWMVEAEGKRSFNHSDWQIERVQAGQICAAIITHVMGDGNSDVNLKLILDAPFDYWIKGIKKWNGVIGQGSNKWRWPLESQFGEIRK